MARIEEIIIENFKGIQSQHICFGNRTDIKGQNASCKTSILDAFDWCLFNMNSAGDTKFEIRPLDKDGNKIHNVEISVTVVLSVDGKKIELKKTQKENWVKHHGNQEAILEGNINTYEINGYPKKEKDYTAFIKEIIDIETFKMLSDPRYFPNKNWKEQRKILMSMYDGKSDAEIVAENTEFAPLKDDIEVASSVDDIKSKYQKALTELKKHMTEIPVRIDELFKQKVEVDVDELQKTKKELSAKVFEIDNQISANSNKNTIKGLMIAKQDAEITKKKIEAEVNAKNEEARIELKSALATAHSKASELDSDVKRIEYFIQDTEKRIADCENERQVTLKAEYVAINESKFDESAWQFDESTTVCSLCGQQLPEEKINELKSAFADKVATAKKTFEDKKSANKQYLINKGKEVKTQEDEYKKKLESLVAEKSEKEMQLATAVNWKEECRDKVDNFKCAVILTDIPEYNECINAIADYGKRIEILEGTAFDESPLIVEKKQYEDEIASIDIQIASVENNARLEARIKELEEEQLNVAQRMADQEKMLYLVDEFIKYKLNLISGAINSQFNGVEFKLFNQQINGSIAECCEATINGVPYSDANSGHKLVAGLEIIKALQKFYGKQTVVFLDNAESINDFNIPEMDNQLITMSVSDDKILKIELRG